MSALAERMARPGPKKLLAIDGGGIRGVLALEILAKIEAELRAASGNADYRLATYFDAIAGTSTGGIIAAGLALGMSVSELLDFYVDSGAAMFQRSGLLRRVRYKFVDEPLAAKLKETFGDRTLGSADLRTVLMLVMRNATTDSPWPVSNNPYAYYNRDLSQSWCNLNLPLWQLVRASTAAPTFFPPEKIIVGDRSFLFVDGGVTMYNNPAFQLFLMMTVDAYWRAAPAGVAPWRANVGDMLLVSVGTGTSPGANDRLDAEDMTLLFNASTIPSALMFSALQEQDALCRVFGDCHAGDQIDRELGTLIGSEGPLGRKLFRYVRYNAELTAGGLQALGCGDIDPARVQRLDSVAAIPELRRVGRAVAERKLHAEHLGLARFAP
ncbi:patatin-like phospholipase family protein [Sphingomonas sp. CARO-RG-8B-R24-01]|uniref:patatin-like phospholipase family protein n=1 Tax=Sphingomonas sp. CARO-RG-8B-R24-01 TaxID=2914831 RepID=UPI001F59A20B|nr:patatin-like phospholipase family protein [Sphingomonas sp. CARO-RG-8B-R24-01]